MFVSQVLLKLLARIDYGRNRGALRSNAMEDLKRKKFKRWVRRTLSQAAVVRELGNYLVFSGPLPNSSTQRKFERLVVKSPMTATS